ncbi:hypothetical protein COLO4_37731 [Corchorus olitorius]|uniref:Uncharacterized protein n=1 Tax=Corchorus olitorius TaxID=93759 RepID=A0A1R3FZS4_9ROSI|nr:hypothetical protein COLO4_37731 [Corchorus olitorius]
MNPRFSLLWQSLIWQRFLPFFPSSFFEDDDTIYRLPPSLIRFGQRMRMELCPIPDEVSHLLR